MWESLARVNAVVGGVVWGPVGLALLFGTGCLLTVRTGFFQLRYFGYCCLLYTSPSPRD